MINTIDREVVKDKLKSLTRYDIEEEWSCYAGSLTDVISGDYIKYEDIEKLIEEL